MLQRNLHCSRPQPPTAIFHTYLLMDSNQQEGALLACRSSATEIARYMAESLCDIHALQYVPEQSLSVEMMNSYDAEKGQTDRMLFCLQAESSATEKAKEAAESLKEKAQQAAAKSKEALKTAAGKILLSHTPKRICRHRMAQDQAFRHRMPQGCNHKT